MLIYLQYMQRTYFLPESVTSIIFRMKIYFVFQSYTEEACDLHKKQAKLTSSLLQKTDHVPNFKTTWFFCSRVIQ